MPEFAETTIARNGRRRAAQTLTPSPSVAATRSQSAVEPRAEIVQGSGSRRRKRTEETESKQRPKADFGNDNLPRTREYCPTRRARRRIRRRGLRPTEFSSS